MTTPTRIYTVRVHDQAGGHIETRLVRAPNQAQAVRHVASQTITATPATQDELVQLVSAGMAVETAGEQTAEAQG